VTLKLKRNTDYCLLHVIKLRASFLVSLSSMPLALARGEERAKWALAQLHVKTGAKAQEIGYEEDP
jgi:hypothetical protein